jgi:hypothetical protein
MWERFHHAIPIVWPVLIANPVPYLILVLSLVAVGFVCATYVARKKIAAMRDLIAFHQQEAERRVADAERKLAGADDRIAETDEQLRQANARIGLLLRRIKAGQLEKAAFTTASVAQNIKQATRANTSAQKANTDVAQTIKGMVGDSDVRAINLEDWRDKRDYLSDVGQTGSSRTA